MKKSKFTEAQIFNILKEVENGIAVGDVCRQYGISGPTFYKWRAKYGGMDLALVKKLKSLEMENARLKRMYADVQLDKTILEEALKKL
jgi:putative transposase